MRVRESFSAKLKYEWLGKSNALSGFAVEFLKTLKLILLGSCISAYVPMLNHSFHCPPVLKCLRACRAPTFFFKAGKILGRSSRQLNFWAGIPEGDKN